MAYKSLGIPRQSSKKNDLPFLDEYLDSFTDLSDIVGTVHDIHYFNFTPKGVAIATEFFVVFFFKSHSYHDFLKEAVTLWASDHEKHPLLGILVLNDLAEVDVVLDDEKKDSMTTLRKRRKFGYSQYNETQGVSTNSTSRTNPFLKEQSDSSSKRKTTQKK